MIQFLKGLSLCVAQSDDFGHVAVSSGSEEPNLLAENVAQVSSSLHQLLNSIQLRQDTFDKEGNSTALVSIWYFIHVCLACKRDPVNAMQIAFSITEDNLGTLSRILCVVWQFECGQSACIGYTMQL